MVSKSYVIAHMNVKDPAALKDYIENVNRVLPMFGAKPIARGGRYVQLEGESLGNRHVIHEFPSYEAALDMFESKEYQDFINIRHKAAISWVVVVEGI